MPCLTQLCPKIKIDYSMHFKLIVPTFLFGMSQLDSLTFLFGTSQCSKSHNRNHWWGWNYPIHIIVFKTKKLGENEISSTIVGCFVEFFLGSFTVISGKLFCFGSANAVYVLLLRLCFVVDISSEERNIGLAYSKWGPEDLFIYKDNDTKENKK